MVLPQEIGKNGGEDTLAHWPIASGKNIEECTCQILKYLDKVWGSLSSSGDSLGYLFVVDLLTLIIFLFL